MNMTRKGIPSARPFFFGRRSLSQCSRKSTGPVWRVAVEKSYVLANIDLIYDSSYLLHLHATLHVRKQHHVALRSAVQSRERERERHAKAGIRVTYRGGLM